MKKLSSLAIVVGFLGLVGCATETGADGAFYPQGYSDGCRTAEARQSSFSDDVYRDQTLFEQEASYRSGWRAGYAQCDRMQDVSPRPGDLGEQEPI